ncbi:hypothetical protein QAD02_015114 [Eretmocerus hayati]|uniref:Uncharacterized protein n=1 Tax=Eretmocerus hayati TaxID=131215 RepID=A0ACC2P7R7_9HYME|nr:hypothetical protein QAD02_015114 [Eretmocerus hayati]
MQYNRGQSSRRNHPRKIDKSSNKEHKEHVDIDSARATVNAVKSLESFLGPIEVVSISQDDEARTSLGITAAKKLIVILMHMEYKVSSPDHDFVVGPRDKLIPSVYAVIVIKENRMGDPKPMTYSGPTHIKIRSGKHSSCIAALHDDDIQAMPSKQKVIEQQGSDEEIDLVNIDDTCERATDVMDEIVRAATEQLRILTANTRKSSRRVANAGPNSTDVILTSTQKGNTTASTIKKKFQKNESSATIAKHGGISPTKEMRVAVNLSNLPEEVPKNVESAQNPPSNNKAMQDQLAARELEDRGYTVRTLGHLRSFTQQSQIDKFSWNSNLEAGMLGTIKSAPEPFSACRDVREHSAAKGVVARGCAVRVLDTPSRLSQGLDQLGKQSRQWILLY